MSSLDEWTGRLAGRNDDAEVPTLVMLIGQAGASWGAPFRALADDQNEYFVKCCDACPPGAQASLAIEQIVAGVGRIIDAPVCDTSLVRIPPAMAGREIRAGRVLSAGLAHGSRLIGRAEEGRTNLKARAQDDNRRRHVGVFALFDWCFGADPQW